MISGDTTIERLLDEHPQLLEFLATYHAHFALLRTPAHRSVMAPRVTVAEAARIAGVPAEELLAALRRAAGETPPGPACAAAPAPARDPGPAARPAILDSLEAVEVDVRDDIRRGQEPFPRIMGAVKGLGPGQVLVLRAPFEPIPLYDVLGKRGLAHWTDRHAADDVTVWFYRADAGGAGGATGSSGVPGAAAPVPGSAPAVVTIDVRGLEPPQPLVAVLERLEALAPGGTLEVLHERRPMFLYPQLEDRGFRHETEDVEPGLVRIRIRREEGAR